MVEITAAATHELRRRVLRAGRADADVRFAGDEDAATLHLAAADRHGRALAVGSAYPRACRYHPGRVAWQVRGMAVAPERQGEGLGGRVLEAIAARAAAAGVEVLWADARDSALGFYRRHGWVVEGERYVTPATGLPHHTVICDLVPPP